MTSKTSLSKEQIAVINRTEEYVKETLKADSSGHDWWHIDRVRNMAVRLAETEGVDRYTVELAALLHDIADWKFNNGDTTIGASKSREWLSDLAVEPAIQDKVYEIVAKVSFKGAGVKALPMSIEGQIVQDADRLDAIGAVGIARTFAYGGHFNRTMHDPNEAPAHHDTFEKYKDNKGTTINHFYEKLLLLKDRLNTKSAREIAEHRHRFTQDFLNEFFDEWKGLK